jgi:hypothetical protein
MNDKPNEPLDRLFAAVRSRATDTARAEFGFETRLIARLREERRDSVFAWAWRLCPFFAAVALAVGWINFGNTRAEADAQIVLEATQSQDDQLLLAYMTGEHR